MRIDRDGTRCYNGQAYATLHDALAAVAAAILATLVAAVLFLAVRDVEAQEAELTAVVCRLIGSAEQ